MLPKDDVYDEVEPRIIHVNMQCIITSYHEMKVRHDHVLFYM